MMTKFMQQYIEKEEPAKRIDSKLKLPTGFGSCELSSGPSILLEYAWFRVVWPHL